MLRRTSICGKHLNGEPKRPHRGSKHHDCSLNQWPVFFLHGVTPFNCKCKTAINHFQFPASCVLVCTSWPDTTVPVLLEIEHDYFLVCKPTLFVEHRFGWELT